MSDTTWAGLVAAHDQASPGPAADIPEHRPQVAILACSDARVPPSVIFDQPAGSLFVVRIAGNTATEAGLASLDYAVDHLGVRLVVVLGHTGCGAVEAAATGACHGLLAPIVEPICETARAHPHADLDELVDLNVAETLAALAKHHGPVGMLAREGQVELRGAVHDLGTGMLRTLPLPQDVRRA